MKADNPEADGTDAAHPAWWRGHDAGCLHVTRKIQSALDGADNGTGTISHPEVEKLRREVLAMKAREAKLREGFKWVLNVIDLDAMNAKHPGSYERMMSLLYSPALAPDAGAEREPTTKAGLQEELCAWLDKQTITSENIGQIRRACFMPWDSKWNAIVRDETAAREKSPDAGKEQP